MSALGSAASVQDAFDEAAPRYDLMVALNPGYHRHLRSAATALLSALPGPGRARLLDLGCGSGASTRALLAAAQATGREVDIVGVDASAGMLARAASKRWPAGVAFRQARAEEIGALRGRLGLETPLSGVFAAYLFRNVEQRSELLESVRHLLQPGGVLVVQEYSVAGSRTAALVWSAVCWLVIIPLSRLTGGRTRLYRYLWRSVRRFDSVQEFVDRLYAAGFRDVVVRTVPGWQRGILHTFRCVHPGP